MSTSPRIFALAASLVFAAGIGLVAAAPSQAASKTHAKRHHRHHHTMHHTKHMTKAAKK